MRLHRRCPPQHLALCATGRSPGSRVGNFRGIPPSHILADTVVCWRALSRLPLRGQHWNGANLRV